MRLRTLVALLLVAATALVASPQASAKPYAEPAPGGWHYDQYGASVPLGGFRVRPGNGAKPPKVLKVRFRLDASTGRCPKLYTPISVVAPALPLVQAPELRVGRTRYPWALARAGGNGLEPVPVQVSVAGAPGVPGTLAMLLQQSFEGGSWRWVVQDTVLTFGDCRVTPVSGRANVGG